MRVRRTVSVLTAALTVAALPLVGTATASADVPNPVTPTLPALRISDSYVAGISSGGYMATQLQVAYSATFRGAGIFSAGPYYCAQDSLVIALTACTANTVPTNLPALIEYTDRAAQSGLIDPTSNLRNQPTWAFHGTQDTTVYGSVADDLAGFYQHYGTPLTYSSEVAAGHAWISPLGPNTCGITQAPFINDCGFDAERDMLKTMFGRVDKPNTGTPKGAVIAYSQDPYAAPPSIGAGDLTRVGAAAIGMGPTGYLYLPKACADGKSCRLVVALHGCLQTAGQIGTTFVDNAFLNQYADSNKLVVLYPQARVDETFGNPKGCWDWWGYLGPNDTNYATRSGPQMATVMNMVHALGG